MPYICEHGKSYGCIDCKRERSGPKSARGAEKAFENLSTPKQPPKPTQQNPTLKDSVISEDDLRRSLGLTEQPRPKIPDSYRSLLNLDPQDIIEFFDVKIGEHTEFTQADSVVPGSVLEHRINRLKKIIECSKQIVEGMASRIIKLRREKDDPLLTDKATREKYKREENARTARSNARLFRYRAALRSGNYHENIWQWVTKPVYFYEVVDDNMEFTTITDVQWEWDNTSNNFELFEYFRRGFVNLNVYRAVMSLGEAALDKLGETETKQKEMWQWIKQWENQVIRAAVQHKLITPRPDLAELLGLGAVLDEDDDPIEADTTEDKLAIKTGGACYGGGIRGDGFRYTRKPVARALSSFDKPLRNMSGEEGNYRDPGFQSLREVSDDAESYDPR